MQFMSSDPKDISYMYATMGTYVALNQHAVYE